MTSKVVYTGNLRTVATHLLSSSTIETDAPVDNHGRGERFSPTDLVATALASCIVTTMGILGPKHDINVNGVECMVEKIMTNNPRRIGEIKIDLDFSKEPMRKALTKAMQYWVKECDIDGYRCDMAHLVPLDFWINARKECEETKPLFWLAECDVPEYHQAFDASYAWDWMHYTEKHARQEMSLHEIRNTLHKYSQYPNRAIKLFFTTNHDENSWNGTELEKYGPLAKAWSVFSATWKGLPLIYSGQEIPNKKRLAFFDKDEIDWNQPLEMESFYTQLLQIRKTNKAISEGETFILPSNNDDALLAFMRKSADDCILVILNLSTKGRIKIQINHGWLEGLFENVFSGFQFQFKPGEEFELQAGEYIFYKKIKDKR